MTLIAVKLKTPPKCTLNSLPTKCRLLITFANSLDPDQARQNVGPDLDQNCLTLWSYSWKNFSKKLILKKISRRQKKRETKFPMAKELIKQLVVKLFSQICFNLYPVNFSCPTNVWFWWNVDLLYLKIKTDFAKFVLYCSHDWCSKG